MTLTLRPTRRWRGFTAGQYLRVSVLIDGVRRTRCYSPANSALRTDGTLDLTVKAHPDGLVSRYLHDQPHPAWSSGCPRRRARSPCRGADLSTSC